MSNEPEETRLYATIDIEIPLRIKDKELARRSIKNHLNLALYKIDDVVDISSDYSLTCNFKEERIQPHAEASTKWFEEHREELIRDHYQEYVCLEYDKVLGFFPTQEEASDQGPELSSKGTFYMIHVVPEEEELVYSFFGGEPVTKKELREKGQDID